jgi:hypothetical protein
MLPAMVGVPVELNVNDEPVVVSDFAASAPVSVTVPEPEAASKNTSSALVGAEAPLAPPLVADQLVVVVVHVPVPPTQYLFAITQPEVQRLPANWTSVVVSWLQFAPLSRLLLRRLTKLKHRKIIRIGFQIEN